MNCSMPIRVERFFKETQGLTLAEVGEYAVLLCEYWQNDGEPITERITDHVNLLFKETKEGYIHLEMDAELKVARLRHDTSVRNGKLGGRPVAEPEPQKSAFQYPSSDSSLPPWVSK